MITAPFSYTTWHEVELPFVVRFRFFLLCTLRMGHARPLETNRVISRLIRGAVQSASFASFFSVNSIIAFHSRRFFELIYAPCRSYFLLYSWATFLVSYSAVVVWVVFLDPMADYNAQRNIFSGEYSALLFGESNLRNLCSSAYGQGIHVGLLLVLIDRRTRRHDIFNFSSQKHLASGKASYSSEINTFAYDAPRFSILGSNFGMNLTQARTWAVIFRV